MPDMRLNMGEKANAMGVAYDKGSQAFGPWDEKGVRFCKWAIKNDRLSLPHLLIAEWMERAQQELFEEHGLEQLVNQKTGRADMARAKQ